MQSQKTEPSTLVRASSLGLKIALAALFLWIVLMCGGLSIILTQAANIQ